MEKAFSYAFYSLWPLAALIFIVLPITLWIVEIPILRRLHNLVFNGVNTACPHKGKHTQTAYFGDRCRSSGPVSVNPEGPRSFRGTAGDGSPPAQ